MTKEELKEIALRFAVQADRGGVSDAPETIVKRAATYFDFLTGKEAPANKRSKR